ncbi:MAG: DUF1643 domain-containing protein [Actinobacteria bacterium]|nr:DUF1643 domain-containing protein [Actinomycetota bacterium]
MAARLPFEGLEGSSATFSPCGRYRYTLERSWADDVEPLVWIMLNPSTADAELDDPTIRRVTRFTRDAGVGALLVVNLYALRATDPARLWNDPVGPVGSRNDEVLAEAASSGGGVVVAAWGALAPRGRVEDVLAGPLAGVELLCLGTTAAGAPRHPLYVRADQPLVPWPGL